MKADDASAPRRSRFRTIPLIAAAALFFLCVWGFLEIAADFPEGSYLRFDTAILKSLRTSVDPAIPRGPLWLKSVMRDISALGSSVVLTIVAASTIGYLVLRRRWINAVIVFATCVGGSLLNAGLKAIVQRARPDVVPHLAEVTSTSFPSGHSMLSAIIYLSLGAMLARGSEQRSVRIYVIAVAAALAIAVGLTRVYLGVHFPSDVVAGWAAGIAWTLACVAGAIYLQQRTPTARGEVATDPKR